MAAISTLTSTSTITCSSFSSRLSSQSFALTPLEADAPRLSTTPLQQILHASSALLFLALVSGIFLLGLVWKLLTVHNTGRFADGTIFDSSYKRARPLTMRIGVGKVIKGLDQGILGGEGVPPMLFHSGGKRKLQIPPELAYGPQPAGCFPGDCNIPANATLTYDVNFVCIYSGIASEDNPNSIVQKNV